MDIRCINWFESRREQRFIFLKSRTKNGETIFIRFPHYFYYVVAENTYKLLTPPPYKAKEIGDMDIINIDEIVSYNVDIPQRKQKTKNMWLIQELKARSITKTFMNEFLNITWFFIANNLLPNGCYHLDENQLKKLTPNCYHCEEPLNCFTAIESFEVSRSYLFLDIECHFDKKFPSVFINPVSHISCNYIDLNGKEFKFTLINKNMLTENEINIAINKRNYKYILNITEMDYTVDYTLCSEVLMLQIIKKILEQTFDYIVTFNGHNFDFRYISNRLELLTGERICFKSPDKQETVYMCIYERNLSNHKGIGGMANITYHINNNNGTIYFDLYTFIQKSEKLDSYKLDSISKNVFNCMCKITKYDGVMCTFEGNNTTDIPGMATSFAKVLTTGNYVMIGDDVCKIINKTINENGFTITLKYKKPINESELYNISFGKDDVDLSQMYKNYNLDIAIEMANYCIHDACLCKYLWNYYGVEQKTDAGAATYVLPQSMVFEYRASTVIKGPLLKLLLETKTILYRTEKKNKYPFEGGKVFAPKQKMFINNVLIFDYNSLYPNVCLFGNLSPETLVGVVVNTNKLESEINYQNLLLKYPAPRYILIHCEPRLPNLISEVAIFDRKKQGTIPKLLQKFLTERARYKKLMKNTKNSTEKAIYDSMQYTYKIVANSVYGLMGFRNSALYSYASAKSCTAIGRQMITYLESVLNGSKLVNGKYYLANNPTNPFFDDGRDQSTEFVLSVSLPNSFNFRSVYGDTDSVFVEINSQDVKVCMEIAKELERIINTKVLFETFKIEFEAIYKNLIMQSKKKYTTMKYPAGCDPNSIPERINKGTSETRRDVSRFHKEMIKTYKTRISHALSEGVQTPLQVCVDVLTSLENDLRIEFDLRSAPLELFLLSRTHHCNYKSADNPNMFLVNEYNKNNSEVIEIGERYYFGYICDKDMPWQKKLVNIKTYERIIDRGFKMKTNERIFYEVYFKRLATEIVNLLDNKVLATSFFERLFGNKPVFYN
ncbi:DNA polymerase [Eptesipox virus]|uniref:DNA polymerase n=1 Tax=Eptesipox virus TaxID=1329402 RepID=A0A220T6B3_9POXV|nr:DNA polymerase [Eptesipox virus]ASK51242.1 DNA polymerase [Eptesipox virus]